MNVHLNQRGIGAMMAQMRPMMPIIPPAVPARDVQDTAILNAASEAMLKLTLPEANVGNES